MSTPWRIRDRSTFVDLRRRGRRVRCGQLTLTWVPRPVGQPPQVAYAVGRAVGRAVVRNRLRRRLRSAVAQLSDELPPGAYLVGASPGAAVATTEALLADLRSMVAALRRRVAAEQEDRRR